MPRLAPSASRRGAILGRRAGALFVCAACSGCAGEPAEPRLGQPPQATTPEAAPAPQVAGVVAVSDSACAVDGVSMRADRAFLHQGMLCGCMAGQLHCADAGAARCFFGGQWYPRGATVELADPWRSCACLQAPRWTCAEQPRASNGCPKLVALAVVRFEKGSSALPPDASRSLDPVIDFLPSAPAGRVKVEARATFAEEPNATELAQHRAEAVLAALEARGLARDAIDLDNLGTRTNKDHAALGRCRDRTTGDPAAVVEVGVRVFPAPGFSFE